MRYLTCGVLVVVAACSGGAPAPTISVDPVCEAGAQQDCKCLPDLRPGIQLCAGDGAAWWDCACGDGEGQGGGAGDGGAGGEGEGEGGEGEGQGGEGEGEGGEGEGEGGEGEGEGGEGEGEGEGAEGEGEGAEGEGEAGEGEAGEGEAGEGEAGEGGEGEGEGPACEPTGEVCDGEDNDCDGEIDEAGCDPPLGGESCAEPLDLEIGVVLEGSLEGARNDHLPGRDCFPEDGPDHVLRFELPGDPGQDEVEVRIDTEGTRHGVFFSLRREDCEAGEGPGRREGCFEDDRGFEGSLRAGVWYLVIEGTPRFPEGLNYRVTVTIVL